MPKWLESMDLHRSSYREEAASGFRAILEAASEGSLRCGLLLSISSHISAVMSSPISSISTISLSILISEEMLAFPACNSWCLSWLSVVRKTLFYFTYKIWHCKRTGTLPKFVTWFYGLINCCLYTILDPALSLYIYNSLSGHCNLFWPTIPTIA